MSHLFFGVKIDGDALLLDGEEAKHCTRVLRHGVGDQLLVTSGEGVIWEGTVRGVSKESVTVQLDRESIDHRNRPMIWLAVGPTKNLSRIEWLIEKGTELGLRRFTPLITTRGEKLRVRKDRLERIARSAVKQSLKGWEPVIDEPTSLADLFSSDDFRTCPSRYIGFCGPDEKAGLSEDYSPGSNVIFLIGPEGDFTPEEVEMAQSAGCHILDLGPDRFRTETASLQALSVVYEINRHAKKI